MTVLRRCRPRISSPATLTDIVAVRVQQAAALRIDDIYRYSRQTWGVEQADRYVTGLFEAFDGIDSRRVHSRPVPAEFGVDGFYFRYEQHMVYWRRLANGDVGIVTVLHIRMHQMDRFSEDTPR